MMKSKDINWGVKLVNGGAGILEIDLNTLQSNPNIEIVNVVTKNNSFYIIYKEYNESDNDKIQQFQ